MNLAEEMNDLDFQYTCAPDVMLKICSHFQMMDPENTRCSVTSILGTQIIRLLFHNDQTSIASMDFVAATQAV